MKALLKKYMQIKGCEESLFGDLASAVEELKITYLKWQANHTGYTTISASYGGQLIKDIH